MSDALKSAMYEALERIKPSDVSWNEWATRAKVGRSIFADIRRHGNPTSDTLDKLLAAIGVNRAAFESGLQPVRSEVLGTDMNSTRDIRAAFYGDRPLKKLPIVGSAAGGEYGNIDEDIEMVEVNLGEVLMFADRPASLADDRDAYGLTIIGESMAPRFKPREQVAVSPRSAVAIGDYVIVQLRGVEGDDERIRHVLIKELVKVGSNFIELAQYRPEKIFRVDRNRVAAMHRVAGHLY